MKSALEMAKISTGKVQYINAWTSTKKGDEIEINAISRLFKHKIYVAQLNLQSGTFLGLREV